MLSTCNLYSCLHSYMHTMPHADRTLGARLTPNLSSLGTPRFVKKGA